MKLSAVAADFPVSRGEPPVAQTNPPEEMGHVRGTRGSPNDMYVWAYKRPASIVSSLEVPRSRERVPKLEKVEQQALLPSAALAVRAQRVVVGPPRPGQVGEPLREEEEEAVHARAEETDGRAVSPDLVPLLAHSPLVLDPLQGHQPLELFLPLDVQLNLWFAGSTRERGVHAPLEFWRETRR